MNKKLKETIGIRNGSTRGTKEQGQRAYEADKKQMEDFKKHMDYIESQLSDNRGGKKK